MQKSRGLASWISLSDLMTGLVLVFLLIVVVMQQERYNTLVRYENTKQDIFDALDESFSREKQDRKMTISEDLVIRFLGQDVNFEKDSIVLSRHYKDFLDDFIPKYLKILTDERFAEHIREVRIEGHTAKPSPVNPRYIDLVTLSQGRARAILQYFVDSGAFRGLNASKRSDLRFKLMASGFGNGRMINSDGKYVLKNDADEYVVQGNGQPSNPDSSSRRVEFRIVTHAEQRIAEALEQL